MTFQSLEQVGLIEHYRVAKDEIRHVLKLARRDMKTARELMNINLDWALIAAYNAALQAGLAVMYTKDYRPKGPDWHKNVIRFLHATLEPSFRPKIIQLDQIRKKRHQVLYHSAGEISEREPRGTIEFAEEFLGQVANLI